MLLLHLPQATLVVVEETGACEDVHEARTLFLVGVLEDVLAEELHLVEDVPTLVVVDGLEDVFHDPPQHDVAAAKGVDHRIDGKGLHFLVSQLDAEVGGEVELAGEVAQYALEELVDGLHTEIGVVVDKAP